MHSGAYQARRFLFLQGPHGPFFEFLAQKLREEGHAVNRINFNGGDKGDWSLAAASPFTGSFAQWPSYLSLYLFENEITDVVFYGYWRPLHKAAIDIARKAGIRLHGFEEGLLRPHWITVDERLPCEQADDLKKAVPRRMAQKMPPIEAPPQPPGSAIWRQVGMCLRYYKNYYLQRRDFSNYRTHRTDMPSRELWLWTKQVLTYPWRKLAAKIAKKSIFNDERPLYLLCLQLAGDSQIRQYSNFAGMGEVMGQVIASFARHAPGNTRLVIKKHPLDSGDEPLKKISSRLARAEGVANRVQFVEMGKLAGLLKRAQGMVTVNSSAGLQALYHGCPVKTLGQAIYNIPGLADPQPLDTFWTAPQKPNAAAYQSMQDILIETSQHIGSFYMVECHADMAASCMKKMLQQKISDGAMEISPLRRYG